MVVALDVIAFFVFDLIMPKRIRKILSLSRKPNVYGQIIPTEGRVSEADAAYRALRSSSDPKRQLHFDFALRGRNGNGFRDPAFAENKTQPVHRWVLWIAGFSSQFVEDCFGTFLRHRRRTARPCVLDPFAGVGTTLFQALLSGYDSVGLEINPYAALACKVKLNSPNIDLALLEAFCHKYQEAAAKGNRTVATRKPNEFRSRIPFFSPRVEEQVLTFLDFVQYISNGDIADLFKVAFGSVMVTFSNYTYEPSLGSRPGAGKPLIEKADVHSTVLKKLHEIISDIRWVKEEIGTHSYVGKGQIHNMNFMESAAVLPDESIDLMVTSPPYMNNYHYVRNTRPQLFWLSLVSSPKDLKLLEEANFGKYWQTVRDMKPLELNFDHPGLFKTLADLRLTRKEKGAYGGPGWANYVTTYFNDCYRFLVTLKRAMKRGGIGVVVIGNSIIQGHEIKTDVILADIAQQIGFNPDIALTYRNYHAGAAGRHRGLPYNCRGNPPWLPFNLSSTKAQRNNF